MAATNQRGKKIWAVLLFDSGQPSPTTRSFMTSLFAPISRANVCGHGTAKSGRRVVMCARAPRPQAQAYWGVWPDACGHPYCDPGTRRFWAVADSTGKRCRGYGYFLHCLSWDRARLGGRAPQDFSVFWAMFFFGNRPESGWSSRVFTNLPCPDCTRPRRRGRLSGSGWAFGYVGRCSGADRE